MTPLRLSKAVKCLLFSLIPLLAASSCSDNKFKVKGEIYGAGDKTIVLEKSDFQGRWYPVDSTHINKNGGFSIAFPASNSPEIYRLSLNNQYIYFPVDSTETITVNSSFDKFGHNFSLAGSNNATKMENFEKELHKLNYNEPDSVTEFKRYVYSNYMKDAPGSILSYYILTKIVDGKMLYDPANPTDRKYFGAVANGYKTVNPDDPHAALLEQVAIETLKQKNKENGKFKAYEADEISLIDINLQDENGNYVKLSDIAGKGKPVVVIFSLLNMPETPELNLRLAEIYKKHSGNVEFYNVSPDEDQYTWREAAKNLPWITVYSPSGINSEDVRNYNAYELPAFYIYNANGELTSRPITLEELNKSL